MSGSQEKYAGEGVKVMTNLSSVHKENGNWGSKTNTKMLKGWCILYREKNIHQQKGLNIEERGLGSSTKAGTVYKHWSSVYLSYIVYIEGTLVP